MFDQFYHHQIGVRWTSLKEALLKPERQVLRWNAFARVPEERKAKYPAAFEGCSWLPEGEPLPLLRDEKSGLLEAYIMDPASVFAARALGVGPGDRVLDLCAAPGGKTLILAEALAESGELIANEISEERRGRLTKVIQNYIPREVRERIWVRGKDGVQFGLREPGVYDRILLDAPCSGERHLLGNEKELSVWTPRRTEHLASRQYALLAAAGLAVREGGSILYSTCSISTAENDGLIAKLMKKKKGQFTAQKIEPPEGGETTEYGTQFWPDRGGYGPIYYCLLTKN